MGMAFFFFFEFPCPLWLLFSLSPLSPDFRLARRSAVSDASVAAAAAAARLLFFSCFAACLGLLRERLGKGRGYGTGGAEPR